MYQRLKHLRTLQFNPPPHPPPGGYVFPYDVRTEIIQLQNVKRLVCAVLQMHCLL